MFVVTFGCVWCAKVNIVDPMKLTEEFGNILANPVIASRVVATFIVHKGLSVSTLSAAYSIVYCVVVVVVVVSK